jgi:hypothetical protein
MKLFFAGGNGGSSVKIEQRYTKSGILNRLYSYHYYNTCVMIINLKKDDNIPSKHGTGE